MKYWETNGGLWEYYQNKKEEERDKKVKKFERGLLGWLWPFSVIRTKIIKRLNI